MNTAGRLAYMYNTQLATLAITYFPHELIVNVLPPKPMACCMCRYTCHVFLSRERDTSSSPLLLFGGRGHTVPARVGRRPGAIARAPPHEHGRRRRARASSGRGRGRPPTAPLPLSPGGPMTGRGTGGTSAHHWRGRRKTTAW